MKTTTPRTLCATAIACLLAAGALSNAADKTNEATQTTAQVRTGDNQAPFRKIEEQVRVAIANPAARRSLEETLVQMLSKDASYESKAFACKQLAIIGGVNAIDPLAKLLNDEQATGVACLALARIPARKVDDVLRSALSKCTPVSKVQILNALGARRDIRSLETFEKSARSEDRAIAESAIAAIGKLGTAKALKSLSALQMSIPAELRPSLNEAILVAAESLEGAKDQNMAVVVYNQLLAQEQPAHLRRASFSHLIRLDPDSGVQRILETLQGSDSVLRPLAIQEVRNVRSRPASDQFVAALRTLSEPEQAWMIQSLARRDDLVARAAVANAVSSPLSQVRNAALEAIAEAGGANSVPMFVKALTSSQSQQEAQHAETLLTDLSGGRETDEAIIAAIQVAAPTARAHLIKSLAMRQGQNANRILIDQAASKEPETRNAALQALSKTATGVEAGPLLRVLRLYTDEPSLLSARLACERAISQEKNPNVRSSLIRNALGGSNSPIVRSALVQFLPMAADSSAWRSLQDAYGDPDTAVKHAAFNAAAEWPNYDAWELLWEAYTKPGSPQERSTALRALARLAAEASPAGTSVANFERLLTTAQNDNESKIILSALAGTARPENLELAVKQISKPGVKAEASAAVQRIANAIKDKYPQEAAKALQAIAAK